MKVNILGTEYTIIKKKKEEDSYLNEKGAIGYCDYRDKQIAILDFENDERYKDESANSITQIKKETLLHEIIHAFYFESGLNDNALQFDGAWSRNEEMIDWFAIQSSKIYKVFEQLGLL